MKNNLSSLGKKAAKVAMHLGLMLLVLILLVWIAKLWMGSFTRHGENLVVPDLKGLTFNEAAEKLHAEGFSIELLDSSYFNARPGEIVDQNPKPNNNVKPGRTVYVTIQAFSPEMIIFPEVNQLSLRTALNDLHNKGIRGANVTVTRVPYEFSDVVLGAKYNGKPLSAGAKIPKSARIELLVGEGIEPEADEIEAIDDGTVSKEDLINLN